MENRNAILLSFVDQHIVLRRILLMYSYYEFGQNARINIYFRESGIRIYTVNTLVDKVPSIYSTIQWKQNG